MLATCLVSGSLLALAACESSQSTEPETAPSTSPAAMGMLNGTCPMSDEPVDPNVSVDYHGHKIGFCCEGCVGPWKKMSDQEKAAFVTKHSSK